MRTAPHPVDGDIIDLFEVTADIDTEHDAAAAQAWCTEAQRAGVSDAEPLRSATIGGPLVRAGDRAWLLTNDNGIVRPEGTLSLEVEVSPGSFTPGADAFSSKRAPHGLLWTSNRLYGTVIDVDLDELALWVLTTRGVRLRVIDSVDLGAPAGTTVHAAAHEWFDPGDGNDEWNEFDATTATAQRDTSWPPTLVATWLSEQFGREIGTRYADTWLRRHRIPAISRDPGRTGKNRYSSLAVDYAARHVPGQGARTDKH